MGSTSIAKGGTHAAQGSGASEILSIQPQPAEGLEEGFGGLDLNQVFRANRVARTRKMRMKLNKSGQLLLVSAASLVVAGAMSACATLTVDFVYVTSALAAGPNSYGEVDVFEVNSESGRMRQIPSSPFPSGGRNPVAEVVSPDNQNLYVVNRDDNSIVQFAIGNDGKVYPQNTVNTPGVFPMGTSIAGSNLFVADTYQPLASCSPASPCSGSIAVFPLLPGTSSVYVGSLQKNTPINTCNGLNYLPLTVPGAATTDVIAPTAIHSLVKGSNLFVAAQDTTTQKGYLFGYSIGSASCSGSANAVTLTPLPGSPWTAGKQPSAIAQDPTGTYVYVTDEANAAILGFSVGSAGLTSLSGSPFLAGNMPTAMVIDSTGKYAYVANAQDSNITGYSLSNGSLSRLSTYTVGTQPVAIGIDPSMNQYLYTANFLGNSVSGFQLNMNDGSLLVSQGSPSKANANPTAVAAIPHNGQKH